ncbi:hypothetical protein [Prevotella fusca]
MAQSYIPAGTDVICTEMMSTLPSQIVTERKAKVLYGKEKKALLNTCDKKLTCQLQCRIKVSYYDGLSGLLLGLTLGAAVVALTVLTCGAGTAVVAAAVIATGALGGAAVYYADKTTESRLAKHECDSTTGGTWELFHRKAYIEGANAVLERSFLTCQKGGIVSLVMSHEKALELSKKISDSNKKILELNYYSNLSQGFVGAAANAFKASGAGDVVGLIIGSGLAVYDYVSGADDNYRNQNMQNQHEYARKYLRGEDAELEADGGIVTRETWRDMAIGGGLTAGEAAIPVIGSNRQTLGTLSRWGLEEVVSGNVMTRGIWSCFTRNTAKNMGKEISRNLFTKLNAQKFGVGVAASLISNGIEWGMNKKENDLYQEMIETINKSRKQNVSGINIQANQS